MNSAFIVRSLIALMVTIALVACQSETPEQAAIPVETPEAEPAQEQPAFPKDRREAEAQLEAARAAFSSDSRDDKRRRYAEALFRVGDIWEAAETIAPLASVESDNGTDLLIAAESALFLFDLERAEKLFDRLLEITDSSSDEYERIVRGQSMVYYHSQQFDKAGRLPKDPEETEDKAGMITFMERFEGEPYQIEWTTPERTGHVPFINDIREPGVLPISKITINGETLEFLLDTGGDRLYLDESVVDRIGLNVIARTRNSYAYTGGEEVDELFGVAETVEFDGVTIRNVPIHTSPLKARGVEVDGIITTGLLKQFLSTVDYDNNEITLRERSAEARNELMASMADRGVIGMPFFMAATHLMFAKGTINGNDDMNMFMDSGLAMSMPAVISNETADLLSLEQNEIGGTDYYWVALDELGLNNLPAGAGQAVGNVFVDKEMYWKLGFSFDALLSHQYLWPLGSWTIDFDEMAYYFPAQTGSAEEAADTGDRQAIKVANTDPYVGSYEVAPGVDLVITAEDGVVFLQAPGQQPIGMEAYDDGSFAIPLAGAEIEFEGDPETGITGLKMVQGANTTVATKK